MQDTKRKWTIPVISICGYSNVGKTTLFCKLFIELERMGFQVLPIKHHGHIIKNNYTIKIERHMRSQNSTVDTMCYRNAGAKEVVLVVGSVGEKEWDSIVQDLQKKFPNKNLLLVEGLKHIDIPKVEIITQDALPVGKNHIIIVSTGEHEMSVNRNNSKEILNQILKFLKGNNYD